MYDQDDLEEKEDLDFLISFCEGLIQKKPDFIEALQALGDAYTKKGWYDKGLSIDEYLSRLQPTNPFILYNLACSYSLTNQTDKALRSIKLAIKHGYRNFDFLKEDKDLTNLRNDSRFRRYFSLIEKKTKDVLPDPIP
jgi:tetratricopeptide (TPR) repeat protein